jgi:hypothetical protein
VFAVPARFRGRFRSVSHLVQGLALTHIGELTVERSIRLVRDGVESELPRGFVHF